MLNGFHAVLDDAREILAAQRPTLSTAAKAHYRAELETDDKERAVRSRADQAFIQESRAIYANKLRLVAADKVERQEAEALIGWSADDLIAKGIAPDVPRADLLRALAEVQIEALIRFTRC